MRLKVKIDDLPDFEIPVGEGRQTIKWLCWAAMQRARTVKPGGCLRVREENLLRAQPHAVWKVAANSNYRPNSDQEMEDGSLKPSLIIADVLEDGDQIHLSLRKNSRPDKDGISPQSTWKKSASKMSSVDFSKSPASENSIGNQLMMNLPNSHPKNLSPRKPEPQKEIEPTVSYNHWKNIRWLPAYTQQTEDDVRLQRDLVDEVWKDVYVVKRSSSLEEKNTIKNVLYSKFNHIFNVFRFYSEPFGNHGATFLNENKIPEMGLSDYLTFLQDNDIITKENSRWFRARVLIARAYSIRIKDVRRLEGMRTATDLFQDDTVSPREPRSPRSDSKTDDKYPSVSLSFFIDLIAETAAAIYASPTEEGKPSSPRSSRLQEYKGIFVEGYRPSDRAKWPHFSSTMLSDFCDKYLAPKSVKTGNRHGIRSVLLDRSVCRRISENMGSLRQAFVEWCAMESTDQSDGASGKEYSQSKSRRQGRRGSGTGEAKKSSNITGLKMSFQLFEKALHTCQLYHPQEDNIVVSSVENTTYPPIEMGVKEMERSFEESTSAASAFKSSMLYDLDDGRTLNYDDVALSFISSHVKDEALLGFNYLAQDSMVSLFDTGEEFPYCSPKKAETYRAKPSTDLTSSKSGASSHSFSWRDVDQSVWRKEFQANAETGKVKLCFTEFAEALMRLGFLKFENTRLSPAVSLHNLIPLFYIL
eukprot:gb/GECG01013150.1/.p1 GENE.gb/GECG01013150.1/~~gb/GECG01013150.1/.p1  ORF type:complete len:699 (+),score=69.94 gb/GECG01013150.1/:1-2097(+)